MLTGFPFPSSGFSEHGTRLMRGSNVKRGEVDWSAAITVCWPKVDGEVARYLLRAGDLVIAMDGALVGRSFATLTEKDAPSLLVQRVARLRGRSVVQQLLGQLVASQQFLDHVDSVKTHTAIPHISPADIRQFAFWIPLDEEEQRAISAALSDVDALLAKLDQLIAKKRDLKQAAMQQLLTGRTRLPGCFGSWEPTRLRALAELTMGRTPSRRVQAFWGPGYPWASIADMQGKVLNETAEQVTEAGAAGMAIIPEGTLLMSFKLSIGRLAFAGRDLFTNEAICAFRKLKANASFLYYALQRVDFSQYGKQAVKGYTLNKQSLNAVEVSLPGVREQEAIAEVLSDMDAELVALEARRDKTRQLKQGMMQALLTGRIRLV
jgi:type I restriction enzyme, S subunit